MAAYAGFIVGIAPPVNNNARQGRRFWRASLWLDWSYGGGGDQSSGWNYGRMVSTYDQRFIAVMFHISIPLFFATRFHTYQVCKFSMTKKKAGKPVPDLYISNG